MPRSKEKEARVTERLESSRPIPPIELDELRKLVRQAEVDGRDTVRIEVTRAPSAKGGTMRLRGKGSPPCLHDPAPRRTAGHNWVGVWAVVDLKVYLRGVDAVCRAHGCGVQVDGGQIMCAEHWKQVSGKSQIAFYTARSRAHVGRVATAQGLDATRWYLAAAVRCICDVAFAAGQVTVSDAEQLVDLARRWVPAAGFDTPTTGPEALGQFIELELGNRLAGAVLEGA